MWYKQYVNVWAECVTNNMFMFGESVVQMMICSCLARVWYKQYADVWRECGTNDGMFMFGESVV